MKIKIKNHKKLFFLLLLLFSFTFVACSETRNRPQEFQIYQGREGVKVKFMDNNPPRDVYENTEIFVLAEIWNKGAFDLIDDYNKVILGVNYDPLYFSVEARSLKEYFLGSKDQQRPLFLYGKSLAYPDGQKEFLPLIMLKSNIIPGVIEAPTTTIEAYACYPYRTFFNQMVCIDTDVFKVDSNPICTNRKIYTHSPQGAPVAVSKVEVDMVPMSFQDGSAQGSKPLVGEDGSFLGVQASNDKTSSVMIMPAFRIFVKNVDQGTVFTSDPFVSTQQVCSLSGYNFDFKSLNTVRVYAALGNSELDCGDGLAYLINGEGFLRCTLDPSELGFINRNYELPLKVELEYFYRVSDSRQIKLLRTLR